MKSSKQAESWGANKINRNGKPFILFEVREPDEYEGLMEVGIKDQLFGVTPQFTPKQVRSSPFRWFTLPHRFFNSGLKMT